MRSKVAKRAAYVLTVPESRSNESRAGVLKFRCYGDSYFLAGVWSPNSAVGGALPKSGREKEIASRRELAQPTAIALAGR
jgi:hypothetical protein